MKHKPAAKKASTAPLGIGIGIGFLFAIALVAVVNYDRWGKAPSPGSPPTTRPASPAKPTVSPAVFRVAAQFICTCGACGGEPLESCQCPTAVEERGYIQQQLASGRSEAEVVDAVQAKYGGNKELAADTAPLGSAAKTGEAPAGLSDQGTTSMSHLATVADRSHIISHFKCPCEQCGIDELSDCECPHPNGAQEVKKFIDDAIAHGQHTVGEIVALVEQRYGGRIR